LVEPHFRSQFHPLFKFVILSFRKRASVFGLPFAPGFGGNGQSLQV
jgi:hypothetical protein